MTGYADRGARALVLLHDHELRRFVAAWKRARAAGLVLEGRGDEAYASLATLLRHVLGAAAHYMTWCCEKLELPDPGFEATPDAERIEAEVDAYLEHVLARWREPLRDVPTARFEDRTYPSAWGTPYCIDAMLEHAVMHPLRHTFQIEEALGAGSVQSPLE